MYQPERDGRKFTLAQRREARLKAWQMHTEEGKSQHDIANHFDVSQATVCNWLKRYRAEHPEQQIHMKIAAKIRAELVCCDIYARMEAVYDPEDDGPWKALRHGSDYHAICFYGEWAARLAEQIS